ncbi:MAG: anti-sigma factor family protein [Saprospiraceae bacterium]
MKSIHLTDEILQAFLLKEIQDDAIATHLAGCSECRERLKEYQFLIDSVQKIKTETFSFDVTTLAMNNIMLYEKKKSRSQELIFWGLLIGLFIGISSFSIPFIPLILDIFYSKSIITTLLVMGTGLGVLLFLLADITRQYKAKEDKIFKNNLQPTL